MKPLPVFLAPAAVLAVALIAALYAFLPEMSRRNLFFSVTVPDDFRRGEKAKRIARGFRVSVLANGAVAMALAALVRIQPLCWIGAILWLTGWVLVSVSRARALALPYAVPPPSIREASVAPRAKALEDRFSLQALPFLPLAAAAGLLAIRWRDLPRRFPVHWGLTGQPNRWASRTPFHVFAPILCGAILCGLIAAISYFMRKWAPRPYGGEAGTASDTRYRSGIAHMILWCEALVSVVFGTVALAPLLPGWSSRRALQAVAVLYVVFVAGLVGWAIRMSKRRRRDPGTAPTDLTPDACWKAGLFYVNADDPALVVEKRIGLGYTLNFAHPASWAILAGLVLAVVSVRLFVRR